MSNKKKKKKKKEKLQAHCVWISIGSIKHFTKILSKQCMSRSDVVEASCKIAVCEKKNKKNNNNPCSSKWTCFER